MILTPLELACDSWVLNRIPLNDDLWSLLCHDSRTWPKGATAEDIGAAIDRIRRKRATTAVDRRKVAAIYAENTPTESLVVQPGRSLSAADLAALHEWHRDNGMGALIAGMLVTAGVILGAGGVLLWHYLATGRVLP